MKIKYNTRVQRKELVLGSIFFSLGLVFVWSEPQNFFRYGLAFLGLTHLISGLYKIKNPYIILENDILKRNGLFPKSIKISDLVKIRQFAGDYILYNDNKKLKINSELVNKHQKAELENALRSLDIPFDESPVIKYNYKQS